MIRMLKLRAYLMLFLTALIWGSTFVAQKSAMDNLGPFGFNAARCLVGAFSLFLISFFIKPSGKTKKKNLIKGGSIAGVLLFAAVSLQQIGIAGTTAGKAGFISSMYIIFVPLIALFGGGKISGTFWGGLFLALFGLYFLCVKGGITGINSGDMTVLFSAVFFALHIICISKYAKKTDPIQISCLQFLIAGLLACVFALIIENPGIEEITSSGFEILFTGVLSCAIGYTLQIRAQKHIRPHIASLILSMESVFAVLSGYLFLNEILTLREIFGCILMFTAVYVAQCHKTSRPD